MWKERKFFAHLKRSLWEHRNNSVNSRSLIRLESVDCPDYSTLYEDIRVLFQIITSRVIKILYLTNFPPLRIFFSRFKFEGQLLQYSKESLPCHVLPHTQGLDRFSIDLNVLQAITQTGTVIFTDNVFLLDSDKDYLCECLRWDSLKVTIQCKILSYIFINKVKKIKRQILLTDWLKSQVSGWWFKKKLFWWRLWW